MELRLLRWFVLIVGCVILKVYIVSKATQNNNTDGHAIKLGRQNTPSPARSYNTDGRAIKHDPSNLEVMDTWSKSSQPRGTADKSSRCANCEDWNSSSKVQLWNTSFSSHVQGFQDHAVYNLYNVCLLHRPPIKRHDPLFVILLTEDNFVQEMRGVSHQFLLYDFLPDSSIQYPIPRHWSGESAIHIHVSYNPTHWFYEYIWGVIGVIEHLASLGWHHGHDAKVLFSFDKLISVSDKAWFGSKACFDTCTYMDFHRMVVHALLEMIRMRFKKLSVSILNDSLGELPHCFSKFLVMGQQRNKKWNGASGRQPYDMFLKHGSFGAPIANAPVMFLRLSGFLQTVYTLFAPDRLHGERWRTQASGVCRALLLTRKEVLSRRVVNWFDVTRWLSEHLNIRSDDVEMLANTSMRLPEYLRLLGKIDLLIYPHGSTHIWPFFLRPGTHVIEFIPTQSLRGEYSGVHCSKTQMPWINAVDSGGATGLSWVKTIGLKYTALLSEECRKTSRAAAKASNPITVPAKGFHDLLREMKRCVH